MNEDSALCEHDVLLVRDVLDSVLEFLSSAGFDDEQVMTIVAARLRFVGGPGLRLVEEESLREEEVT